MVDGIQSDATPMSPLADTAADQKPETSPYTLVTAARNEARYIDKTIRSVAAQTVSPAAWVIVDDGSTDETAAIALNHAAQLPFLRVICTRNDGRRTFASKVKALAIGYTAIATSDAAFVGFLDADVSFAPDYYARILARFATDPRLGLAGGFLCEETRGVFTPDAYNSTRSVPGAVQLFRRACYEQIGGYQPLEYGGIDDVAEIMARMRGWSVESFPDVLFNHHKPVSGLTTHTLHRRFREGRMDFAIGTHPVFELAKCVRRVNARPIGIGALATWFGFLGQYCRGAKPQVPLEVIHFLRREQMKRMRSLVML
jgi:glycosyltransferase involved in cell wall biosynthesis